MVTACGHIHQYDDYNDIEPEVNVINEYDELVKDVQIDKSKLPRLEMIKLAGKMTGLEFPDPLPNCRKCSGKGYTGIRASNSEPIPCKCLYREMDKEKQQTEFHKNFIGEPNRKERRKQEKLRRKLSKKLNISIEGLGI